MKRNRQGASIRSINLVMTVLAVIISILLILATYDANTCYSKLREKTDYYIRWQKDASDLQAGSDYLTEQVRCYAETGERGYLDNYFEEAEVTRQRDNAVARIHEYLGDAPAYHALVEAMDESVALMDREYYSMRLKTEACGYDVDEFPEAIRNVALSEQDAALSTEAKDALARSMVFDQEYRAQKEAISGDVQKCLLSLEEEFEGQRAATVDRLNRLLLFQRALILVSIGITVVTLLLVLLLIVKPMLRSVHYVRAEAPLPVEGASEFRFLANEYNQIHEANKVQKEFLAALLDNMPALNFTKDADTGVYIYCNHRFAEYALKDAPGDVIGLTDGEIFDPETAAHFVACDRQALAMDRPYVFFENTPDAAGNLHRFQTTKMKFKDSTGRLCLLGMCLDVTEVMKATEEKEQAKAAYREALSTSAVYESIVEALSGDYFDLYYVDTDTDDYVEYGSWSEEGQRTTEKRGTDFFAESRRNANSYIYEEDLGRFLEALDKEKLLEGIRAHGTSIHLYRLNIDGVPTYVSMKATRIAGDDRHIIIGVSNVDAQIKDRLAAERAAEERKSYLWLSALNGNLIVLYYVDPETNAYTQFSASSSYEGLGIATKGADFFKDCFANSLKTIHPEDLSLFHAQVTKANILATIERDGVFTLAYRLMSGDLPTYVRLKAARVEDEGKSLLIIGLTDEDAQIRQEKEYARNLSVARKMATVDSLTGVKNKHAYVQWEEKINASIAKGEQGPFAVVVCDVNNLKAVNDLYGHKEGDNYIKKACSRICGIFSHSPVFRIGGDEFVAILSGEDYTWRKTLMEQVSAVPEDPSKARIGETIAAGMAEYRRDRHASLLSVFEEADKAMYDRKQQMKADMEADALAADDGEDSEVIPVINVRKRLLIVDDMEMSREMLGDLLEEDYDILYAADGVEALETMRGHRNEIDLVLLDLQMPNMTGREVISQMQLDEELMSIPVIFLTVDQKAELDCLKIGAMDFIPKPYPDIEIVKARIAKCIELSEDRDLIRHTERDKLTGLLNKDYFFRYVSRLDQIYRGAALDAIVCDINRFHSVNEKYGRQFCDLVLRSIGINIRKLARKTGGIGCRQGGDTFLLYCPHQDDYDRLLSDFLAGVFADRETANKVNLRFGVFADAQREPDIGERFARAGEAADSVKDDPERLCGFI